MIPDEYDDKVEKIHKILRHVLYIFDQEKVQHDEALSIITTLQAYTIAKFFDLDEIEDDVNQQYMDLIPRVIDLAKEIKKDNENNTSI